MKNDNLVLDKSFLFAKRCVFLYKHLIATSDNRVLATQLLKSGTSIGAAYTAGAVALFLEYIEEYRRTGAVAPMDTVLLRNLFSLGAVREEGVEYPSPTYGYGKLNLYGVFEFLRNL